MHMQMDNCCLDQLLRGTRHACVCGARARGSSASPPATLVGFAEPLCRPMGRHGPSIVHIKLRLLMACSLHGATCSNMNHPAARLLPTSSAVIGPPTPLQFVRSANGQPATASRAVGAVARQLPACGHSRLSNSLATAWQLKNGVLLRS